MTVCPEHVETFWSLVTDIAHWELEVFIMVVVDGIALGLAWPWLKKHYSHHLAHDRAHQEATSTPGVAPYNQNYDK